MTGSSKVIMGAGLVILVTLALVLALVLLLLAELYCSIFLRTRAKRASTPTGDPEEVSGKPYSPSLCSFYYQGVLPAPRSFLFPAPENHLLELHKQPNSPISASYPCPVEQPYSPSTSATTNSDEQLVYICNPIYDTTIGINPKVETPFETPGTSPSRLEAEEDSPSSSSNPATPPLTPMKKLPAVGPSVSLRDARSICTTGTDSNNSINYEGAVSVSSSSSDSQKTSPPW